MDGVHRLPVSRRSSVSVGAIESAATTRGVAFWFAGLRQLAHIGEDRTGTANRSLLVVRRILESPAPRVTNLVRSADAGAIGEVTGADLMVNGIAVLQSPTSAAHLLTLVPEQ